MAPKLSWKWSRISAEVASSSTNSASETNSLSVEATTCLSRLSSMYGCAHCGTSELRRAYRTLDPEFSWIRPVTYQSLELRESDSKSAASTGSATSTSLTVVYVYEWIYQYENFTGCFPQALCSRSFWAPTLNRPGLNFIEFSQYLFLMKCQKCRPGPFIHNYN